ncbi:MAG: DUF1861 family protein [Patescibacteria group bacterium]
MNTKKARSCNILLDKYYKKYSKKEQPKGEFLIFDIAGDFHKISAPFDDLGLCQNNIVAADVTIYNPTKPIVRGGKRYLIGRVEPLESEESKVMFFEESDGKWRIVPEAPVFGLQDPFHVENVQGWHILGGVQTFPHPTLPGGLGYRTVFYRYKNTIIDLIDKNGQIVDPFAEGPKMMKDIRLIELTNGKIAVFTRPQGDGGGLGKIGYIEIGSLDELEHNIPMAKIISNQFLDDEWGGANELHLLSNGKVGVLGHVAHFDGDVRHYYAMAFVFDPRNRRATHMEILTTASEFPPVKPKKEDLGRVIFSGGLHRNSDGTADLYVGIGDIKAGKIKIPDPFSKFEK